MASWTTISSLATGAGTLVLAVATFASVRSANRSTRISELALMEQRRPVLMQSRLEDPVQKIMFGEGRWLAVGGSRAKIEYEGDVIYLVLSLRNVGTGIAVPRAWAVRPRGERLTEDHADVDQMRAQLRDLYVPGGDIGIWQGALRDRSQPGYEEVRQAVHERRPLTLELLYTDSAGGQRTITRFGLTPPEEGDEWMAGVTRHWQLDGAGPR